jgi:Tfp pilus assembly protein PilO
MNLSLTKAQQKTLIYIVGALLLLGLSGGLIYDANRKAVAARTLKMDADRQQQEADAITLPAQAEQDRWAASESELSTRLLSDQQVPEFLEDITRIANENHLERLGINNEDKAIDANQPAAADDGQLAAVGIHRYLLVTLKFQSAYADAARFLAAVSRLPSPVELQTIDMRRNPPKVDVTLILKVYKQDPRPA